MNCLLHITSKATTTEDKSENPDQSMSTDERVGFDKASPPEDSSTGSTKGSQTYFYIFY